VGVPYSLGKPSVCTAFRWRHCDLTAQYRVKMCLYTTVFIDIVRDLYRLGRHCVCNVQPREAKELYSTV